MFINSYLVMKKFYFLLVFIFLIVIFINYGCNPTTGGFYPPSVIRGKITDSATHKPLVGVLIQTIPASSGAMSDTSGIYVVPDVPMSSSATLVYVIASRNRYLNDTSGLWISANDTINLNISMIPSNGVFIWNDIQVYQYDNKETISSIDLNNFRSCPGSYLFRDIDLRDSLNAKLRFQFRSSDLDVNFPGLNTKFGYSLGNFSKSEFDTLAMYYGAGEPLSQADFPLDRTQYFYTPLLENSVYPFYLVSRYIANPSLPKIFGLLYIKSATIEPINNRFTVIVDVKLNRNGQNYFLPNN